MIKTYGPIFRIWMGDHYTLVINDISLVKEVWVKNFDNFVNRPHPASFEIYSGNFQDLAFSDEALWRRSRHMVSAAFTKTKLKTIIKQLDHQTSLLIEAMKKYQVEKKPFYCKKYFSRFALNIIFNVLFSEEIPYDEGLDDGKMARLTEPIHIVFKKLGAGSIDDYVSLLSPMFYFNRRHFNSEVMKVKQFMREIYDEHLSTLDKENPRDLLDQMIIESDGNSVDNILHVGMDFMLAGSDSSAGTVEWFCLFMTNNQDVQEKAYDELQSVVGRGNRAETKHRVNTPYMNAIIKEVMRMRPIGPLGIPRQAKEDCSIGGYFVPKGTQMIMNIYGLSNDDQCWVDPLQFQPERFLIDTHTDRCLPFGIGNRNCVGQNMALDELYIACTNILMNFHLRSVDNKQIDDTEINNLNHY
ncbi:cytochrome P450 family protein [Heterostelium album PN500]|uniref:Cytochrome P450 family protein n=1 Tax=Heterostelium pallidum (strain ATCC 26659 / Pp 5 / PN500) TaxID=670386 RepID=D3B333_HETP5|nr:cytochrome P450 family protein [Heterostelium album PN500]EFA83731.1 cytochrome P450 family protein [Heterostelium album PN500]|eukprot:XP_020435848.1 cytochrome P450 family protein [Heterostelium album PN500]